MAKILVNGGAGFIGSHVADVFLGKGCVIAILEESSAGCESNIDWILPQPLKRVWRR